MKAKVTEQGVLIPKQLLGDMDEVEILEAGWDDNHRACTCGGSYF